MTNCHPTTGIRYGVISGNSLDPEVLQDLFYGPDATDLSYLSAIQELQSEAGAAWDNHMGEAQIAASEVDAHMGERERERFIESWFAEREIRSDRDDFIERTTDFEGQYLQIDEPDIEGVYEGVHYLIGWLGGAPLVWVTEGPWTTRADLCSPCVPNAGSLDSVNPNGYECYDVPPDWRFEEN